MDSIFLNQKFWTLADPQPTWMFAVTFYGGPNGIPTEVDKNGSPTDWEENINATRLNDFIKNTVIITGITLPSYHTETVTKKYFGSEKTFPVLRTYGGECTMNFDVRADANQTYEMDKLAQINALYSKHGVDYIRYHPELHYGEVNGSKDDVRFYKVLVHLLDRVHPWEVEEPYGGWKRPDGKVVETTRIRRGVAATYEYNNCVLTDFGFNESLDYSSESKLTGKLSFHYDLWHRRFDHMYMDYDTNGKPSRPDVDL